MSKRSEIERIAFGFLFFLIIFACSSNMFASTISGTIYDNRRNPLVEVDVELLNDYYQQISRARTDGSGRYEFSGLPDGRYTVRVLPFRYDLIDESHQIEIITQSVRGGGQGNTFIIENFYLQPKKGSLRDIESAVIFAQDVPKESEGLYQKAIKDISKNRNDEGVAELREAIKIFPNYFQALYELGKELFIKGEYSESAPVLLKAVEVNPKSAYALYYLGNSFQKLNYNKPAITALTQAHILAPASIQVLYMLGRTERLEGKFEDAEKHLVLAKGLSNNVISEIQKELVQLYANDLKKYNQAADELEIYMKANKLSTEEQSKTKKIIKDLREKAKTQSKS